MDRSIMEGNPHSIIEGMLIAAVAAGLSALCYAEMASAIPVSGSTYSYTYHALGEGLAVLVGGCVLLEYGVAVSAVAVGSIALITVLTVAPSAFVGLFGIFALACVVGYYVVWNVTHALHTPLMSVTNAISGIIIVGAMTQLASDSYLVKIIAAVAVLLASINVFGGFAVTQRMLGMFRKG